MSQSELTTPRPTPAVEPPDLAEEARRLLAARYGASAIAPPQDWNGVISSLLGHRSVRAFTPRPVSDGTLSAAIAAAQSAASSSNAQYWSVVAVRDPERKARLADLSGAQKHIRESPLFLVWLADLSRVEAVGKDIGVEVEGVHYLETLIAGIVDAALAAQNAVAAFESLGLGTVYIGGIRNHPDLVAKELGLPPRVLAVVGLSVGYPDPERPASVKPRLPQEAVLHHETYSASAQKAPIARYNETLKAFQRSQNLHPQDWTQQAAERVRTAGSLRGRDKIREALARIGFELR
jgi:nitroreductase